jgi:4-amino-4-deoxy-L-arabinose transferase-like glycosyltransferase
VKILEDHRRSIAAPDSRVQLTTALSLCLVGFSLLVFQLDEKNLWGDETFRVYTTDVALGDLEGFVAEVQKHVLPPLYPLCLWVWRAIAGSTEFALRFPSVVFATISLCILYRLAVTLLGRGTGLVVLALSAVSPFVVLSSRMVQYYSLLLLLCATSCWLFLQLVQGQGSRAKWAAYVVMCTLAMYTQYFAAFVLAAQGLIALTQVRRRRDFVVRFLVAQAVVVLLVAPAAGILVPQSSGRYGGQDAFSSTSLLISAFAFAYPFFAWAVGGSIFPWNPLGLLGAALVLGLASAGLWATVANRRSRPRTKATGHEARSDRPYGSLALQAGGASISVALTCLALLLLPLCLSVLALRGFSAASGDPFVANRAIFCVPFFYVLVGAGIAAVNRPLPRLVIAVVLGVILGLSLANYYQGREFHNPLYVLPIQSLADAIHQQAQPGDVFVSDEMTSFGYYLTRIDSEATHFTATDSREARQCLESHNPDSVWLILLCRAVETESLATSVLVPWLLELGYSEQFSYGVSPQDDTFARVQELLLHRPACRYKITVTCYARPR